MNMPSPSELTDRIVEKARSLGASVVGIADVEPLKASPSHRIYPKIGMDPDVPWQDAPDEALHHEVDWPADAVSAVVIGVSHPADQPELDWYDGKGTPGNRILIRITKELSEWLEETFSVRSYRPPYFIESTGIFLKDSAVMAGLGSVGKNNLVVTPEYGPRIRWRALLLDREAMATGPVEYDPCDGCDEALPQGLSRRRVRRDRLRRVRARTVAAPGTDGTYDRVTCNTKMSQDVDDAARALAASDEEGEALASTMNAFEEAVMALPPAGDGEPQYGVKYCRRCELSCPVGRSAVSRVRSRSNGRARTDGRSCRDGRRCPMSGAGGRCDPRPRRSLLYRVPAAAPHEQCDDDDDRRRQDGDEEVGRRRLGRRRGHLRRDEPVSVDVVPAEQHGARHAADVARRGDESLDLSARYASSSSG